jgi:hypothetical protein
MIDKIEPGSTKWLVSNVVASLLFFLGSGIWAYNGYFLDSGPIDPLLLAVIILSTLAGLIIATRTLSYYF